MKRYDNDIHAILMRLQHITGATNEMADSWLSRWEQPHRFYHTLDHLFELKRLFGAQWDERDDLFLLAVFHDIVYDPRAQDNELRSKELFLKQLPEKFKEANPTVVDEIAKAIMESKHDVKPETELGKLFCPADLRILTHSNLDELIAYEIKLSKEYQVYPYGLYRTHRIQFLSNWISANPLIEDLIKFIKYRKINIGLYVGSFDPFTIGHQNILEKAERIFDKVVICRGLNPAKDDWSFKLPPCLDYHQKLYVGNLRHVREELAPMEQREKHMAALLLHDPSITLIRGLRGGMDLDMEKLQQIYIQQMMGEVKMNTVYITCDREFEHISSTAFKQVAKVDMETAATLCPNGFPTVPINDFV